MRLTASRAAPTPANPGNCKSGSVELELAS